MKKFFILTFFILIACINESNAATFSSLSSGGWNAPSTWAVTGTDADGIPDADDDVTINAAHSVSLTATNSTFKTLIINTSGNLYTGGKNLIAKGNFTINGSVSGNMAFYVQGNCIFSSATPFTNGGNWNIQAGTLTIAAGTTINKINYWYVSAGCTISNFGNVLLTGGSVSLSGTTSTFINQSGASLTLYRNVSGGGLINAAAASNTVAFNSPLVSAIYSNAIYNNLTINAASTKSLTGNTTVLNNFVLGSGSTNVLNMAGFGLTVGGNWTNNANTNLTNQGTVTFNTSTSQTINRAGSNENLSSVTVSGTGTTVLGRAITITDLTIAGGNLDQSSSNFEIDLKGNFVNNGTLNARSANFNLSGSSLQSLSGTTNTQFFTLTLNNSAGAIVNSAQSVTRVLDVRNGNFNSNGNLTLVSNATTTARIAPVGAGGTFSGAMIVQQFVSTRVKGWHDLSSPVVSTTINDWDNEMYMSGIGPFDGVAGPAGVDGNSLGFPSVYTWTESTSKYVQVTGSSTALVAGRGYEVWFADDQTNWYAKTIDTRGVPNRGTQTINLSFAGAGANKGLNLVGNPFASKINIASCTKLQVSSAVLILDNSGNYNDYGASAVVSSHQGFWLTATGAGASIAIPEAAKSTDNTTNYMRTAPNYGIKLMFSSPNLPYYNENTVSFNAGSTAGYDAEYDALYIRSPFNNSPAIFMLDSNQDANFITNSINSENDMVEIPLGIYTPEAGIYYIEPNVLNTDAYNYVWIENTKTGKKYDLTSGAIAVEGEEDVMNKDWKLFLSKTSGSSLPSQQFLENDLLVFNTEGTLNIKALKEDHILSSISVYDLSGKLVLSQTFVAINAGEVKNIDLSFLSEGMYVVNVSDEAQNTVVKKIVR